MNSYTEDKPFYLQVNLLNPHDICEFLHSFEDTNKQIKNVVDLGLVKEEDLPKLPANFLYDDYETVTQIVCRRIAAYRQRHVAGPTIGMPLLLASLPTNMGVNLSSAVGHLC